MVRGWQRDLDSKRVLEMSTASWAGKRFPSQLLFYPFCFPNYRFGSVYLMEFYLILFYLRLKLLN